MAPRSSRISTCNVGTEVVFQTRDVVVRLLDSAGNPLDTGVVEYYASGWKTFGEHRGGRGSQAVAADVVPLRDEVRGRAAPALPGHHRQPRGGVPDARRGGALARLGRQPARHRRRPSTTPRAGRRSASTAGGEVHKQLLPVSYPFAMRYEGGRLQLSQDITANPEVVFRTRDVVVRLLDSTGNPLDTGVVEYYASGWKTFGEHGRWSGPQGATAGLVPVCPQVRRRASAAHTGHRCQLRRPLPDRGSSLRFGHVHVVLRVRVEAIPAGDAGATGDLPVPLQQRLAEPGVSCHRGGDGEPHPVKSHCRSRLPSIPGAPQRGPRFSSFGAVR